MAKKETRVMVVMACTECKRRNYNTQKNKPKTTDRLELSKYCRFCRCHRPHRETGDRAVAQLVESWSPKPVVAGSSPVRPATFDKLRVHLEENLW